MDRTKARSLYRSGWLLVLGLMLLGSPGAWAECTSGTFLVNLETGQTLPAAPPSQITVQSIGPSANPSCSGWYSAVLRLDLRPPCSEAEIVVEYDKPIAWTVHIADSPTSDGYGGDAGTTLNHAELWLNQQILWIATNRTNGTGDNELVQENLDLNYGALKFAVKNQHISWGPPYNVVETPGLKKLYALPDTLTPSEGYYIYLGLNRVVADFPTRSGCGAQRALVTIE